MSVSNYLENTLLDLTFNGTAYSGQSTVYIKLHTGDPGEACTSNAAVEATRKAVTVGAASSGAVTSDANAEWTNVSTTETITHISIWDASTNGNALWYGALTGSVALTAGDTFRIASGNLTISLD